RAAREVEHVEVHDVAAGEDPALRPIAGGVLEEVAEVGARLRGRGDRIGRVVREERVEVTDAAIAELAHRRIGDGAVGGLPGRPPRGGRRGAGNGWRRRTR